MIGMLVKKLGDPFIDFGNASGDGPQRLPFRLQDGQTADLTINRGP
jgi:hypothetical protein